MKLLGENPPAWVAQYVGIDFRDRGTDRENGLDCYGLARLVYAERFGVILPDLSAQYVSAEDRTSVATTIADESGSPRWSRVERPGFGSVGVFRVCGALNHVGVAVARGKMLHSLRGARSVVESFESPLWAPRLSAWYDFAGPVVVKRRTSILSPGVDTTERPEGATLEDIVHSAGVRPDTPGLRVYIGDREVPRHRWRYVRPRAGRRVVIGVVPESSGKDALRIVLAIVVIVVAWYLGPVVAVGLGFSATGSAAAIATASIALAGTLAVNALVPPPGANLTDAAGGTGISPSIAGARNDIRAFAPVPWVGGTYRLTPPYAARPYTEVVGDDQYLRCLFAWYGPTTVDDIKIGDTPIEEYEGVEIETRPGYADDDPITLYPGVILEQSLSVLLQAVDSWTLRTSDTNADELSVDVVFPQGLAEIGGTGEKRPLTVGLEIEYAVAGSGVWGAVSSQAPDSERALDYFFRLPESPRLIPNFTAASGLRIAWSKNGTFPDAIPTQMAGLTSRYAYRAAGFVYCPVAGVYEFGIDASGACDLRIDGKLLVSWYGSHPPAGTPSFSHYAAVTLSRGYHTFRVRFDAQDPATAAVAFGWKKPGDSAISIVPASNLYTRIQTSAGNGLGQPPQYDYRRGFGVSVFDPSRYGGAISVTDNRTETIRRSLSWAVPRGQYDIRIRRIAPDTDSDRLIDKVYWSAIRTIRNEDPIKMPGLTKIALRIKASDQLNGVVDNLNAIVTSVLPDYDAASGEWETRATRNPASIYRGVLQHPANRKRVGDGRINLAKLASWHGDNVANGFVFDAVYDFPGTVYERLAQIASMGRAAFGMEDSLFSVVQDKTQTTPVQVFTPRNSRSFRGRRSFPDVPHGIRVGFMNGAAGYERDERIVLDDGYQLDGLDAFGNPAPTLPEATTFETLDLFGCTDAALAWKIGRYYIAVARLRPETYELNVDFEHLVCRRGDLVYVTHDVPLLGLGAGRVRQVVNDTSGNAAVFESDAPLEMEAGKNYAAVFRKADGTFVRANLRTEAGEVSVVYFDSVIPAGQPAPAAGDLFAYGERSVETREMIVRAITMGPDLSASLALVDHAPAVHLADSGTIPSYESGINHPPTYDSGPDAPVIDSVRSDDFVMVRNPDGTLSPRIVVGLRRPSASNRPYPHSIQARIRQNVTGSTWRYLATIPASTFSVSYDGVEETVVYEIAVRYISAAGAYSAWATTVHEVIGRTLPPPDVQSFDVVRLADGTRRYSWVLGEIPPDIVGVRIRYAVGGSGLAWEAMADLVSGGILEGASPTDLAVPGLGLWRFAIKMVDSSGLESRNAVFVERNLGPLPADGVALSEDGRSLGWPGTKTNAGVGVYGELFARGQVTWNTIAALWLDWRKWSYIPFPSIAYEHPVIDAGFVFEFEPDAIAVTLGDQVAVVEFDYSLDNVLWNGWQNIDGFEGQTVRGRYVKFRVSVESTAMNTVAMLFDFTMLLRAPLVEEFLNDVDTSALTAGYSIAPGWFFAPVSSRLFSVIRSISVSFNGTGAGWTWEAINKNTDPGPELKIYNPSHTLQDATIDITVRGIRGVD